MIFKTIADDLRAGDLYIEKNVDPKPTLMARKMFFFNHENQLQACCLGGLATIGHCQCIPGARHYKNDTAQYDREMDYFFECYEKDDISEPGLIEWIRQVNAAKLWPKWADRYASMKDDQTAFSKISTVLDIITYMNDIRNCDLENMITFMETLDVVYQKYPVIKPRMKIVEFQGMVL